MKPLENEVIISWLERNGHYPAHIVDFQYATEVGMLRNQLFTFVNRPSDGYNIFGLYYLDYDPESGDIAVIQTESEVDMYTIIEPEDVLFLKRDNPMHAIAVVPAGVRFDHERANALMSMAVDPYDITMLCLAPW